MIVSIKAVEPGRWNVYGTVGLTTKRNVGRIVRTQTLGAAKTYFFDVEGNRHELGSLPKAWPNQIKKMLGEQP